MNRKEFESQLWIRFHSHDDMLSMQDVADILCLSTKAIQKRLSDGTIKSMYIKGRRITAKLWLEEYLKKSDFIQTRAKRFQTKQDKIVEYCRVPHSRQEIQDHFGYSTKEYMRKVLTVLISDGRLAYTEKPHHRNQKYIALLK